MGSTLAGGQWQAQYHTGLSNIITSGEGGIVIKFTEDITEGAPVNMCESRAVSQEDLHKKG